METQYPLSVEYCPICSFPPDLCEFSPRFTQCKKWLAEAHPELYPHLQEEFARIRAGQAPTQQQTKAKPKKVRFEQAIKVTLTPMTRGGKKVVIGVEGLKLFGINLKEASKTLRKALASGCSVQGETLEVQGNVIKDLSQVLVNTFNIPIEDIVTKDPTTKRKKRKN